MQQPTVGAVYVAPPPIPQPTIVYVPVPVASNGGQPQQQAPQSQQAPPEAEAEAEGETQQTLQLEEGVSAPASPRAIIRVVLQSHDEEDAASWFRYGDMPPLTRRHAAPGAALLRAHVAAIAEQVGFGHRAWDQQGQGRVVLYKLRRGVPLRLARDSNRCAAGPDVLLVHDAGFGPAMGDVLRGVEWDAETVFLVVDVSSEPRVVDEAVVAAPEA
ncbi:hypothetical protein CDD82_7486 [Ophiocordyceps australis]|uniref:Uncharacterized protein n=1 Tax=Ophiocordyceps australis TaxID=1399860 RepID=A0A2C5ZLL5_9HYPO|nr:hypothetical protein CDD82_7486 [Ophiocordyceps australis]